MHGVKTNKQDATASFNGASPTAGYVTHCFLNKRRKQNRKWRVALTRVFAKSRCISLLRFQKAFVEMMMVSMMSLMRALSGPALNTPNSPATIV
jgi:hypothetical protein